MNKSMARALPLVSVVLAVQSLKTKETSSAQSNCRTKGLRMEGRMGALPSVRRQFDLRESSILNSVVLRSDR
jgi:hypothetical protein